ncbi:hypothetical protein FACS1894211_05600 [Clostridia bacterium]|nr:hypothetical protein FACS1894211_05600 [Clostridia bacterium]
MAKASLILGEIAPMPDTIDTLIMTNTAMTAKRTALLLNIRKTVLEYALIFIRAFFFEAAYRDCPSKENRPTEEEN